MNSEIVRRLEFAVERLEKIANHVEEQGFFSTESKRNSEQDLSVPLNISKFDEAVADQLNEWLKISAKIGGKVAEISQLIEKAFKEFRVLLLSAAGQLKPNNNNFAILLNPCKEIMNEISEFKSSNRSSEFFNHFSAVDEAKNAFGWVTVEDTPAPFIRNMIDASQFYLNRILKEYKEKDPNHVEWVRSFKTLWESMHNYVKNVHTTGLLWNTNPRCNSANISNKTEPNCAPPPPPPPPFPTDLLKNLATSDVDNTKAKMNALFDEINKGASVTSGLKRVTADMQTHKNPALRKSNTINIDKNLVETFTKGEKTEKLKKPAIYLQDGKQWNIDYFINDSNIEINVTDKKQTVYIYKCENACIKINGKGNAITIDGCKKTSVLFDGLVAQCEIINSNGIQIQTLGELSTVSIQKTDGCQVYLSRKAQNVQIVSSKSSEMNILAQLDENDDEYTEMAVPEQYVTILKGRRLSTNVSEIV